jgi:hypothetical protein
LIEIKAAACLPCFGSAVCCSQGGVDVIVFSVVKERYGWSVRMGDRMTTPFWSRDVAVREANILAQAIRRHGELAQVSLEEAVFSDPEPEIAALTSAGAKGFVRNPTPN